MGKLDEILYAIKAQMHVTQGGEYVVECLDWNDDEMIIRIDDEQFLIQKR